MLPPPLSLATAHPTLHLPLFNGDHCMKRCTTFDSPRVPQAGPRHCRPQPRNPRNPRKPFFETAAHLRSSSPAPSSFHFPIIIIAQHEHSYLYCCLGVLSAVPAVPIDIVSPTELSQQLCITSES